MRWATALTISVVAPAALALACHDADQQSTSHSHPEVDPEAGFRADVAASPDAGSAREMLERLMDASSEGQAVQDAASVQEPQPVAPEPNSMVFFSRFGSGQLRLHPAAAEPVNLSPSRTKDWGLNSRGGVELRAASPDGRWAVVCLDNHTFAVATDGTTRRTPVLLAEVCGSYLFSLDARQLAIVSTRSEATQLWVMPFDPFAPSAPQLLAEAPSDPAAATLPTLRSLVSAGQWWVFNYHPGGQLSAVSLSGDAPFSTTEPPALTPTFGLRDGRALASAKDGTHYVVSLATGVSTRVTPAGISAGVIGTVDDETSAIFIAFAPEQDQLWNIALDGSRADAPIVLSDAYGLLPRAVLLPASRRVIIQRSGTGSLISVPWDGDGDERLLPAADSWTVPYAFSDDERFLFGCSAEDTFMILDQSDAAPKWLPGDAASAQLAEASSSVRLDAPRTWTCGEHVLPVAAGEIDTKQVLAGRLEVAGTRRAAVFLRNPLGEVRRISAVHPGDLSDPILVNGSGRIYFRYREQGNSHEDWYTARLDGRDVGRMVPVTDESGEAFRSWPARFGNTLVFRQSAGGQSEPEIHATTTSRARRIVDWYPSEYPLRALDDGLLIARPDGGWYVPFDGGTPRLLINVEPTAYHRFVASSGVEPMVVDASRDQVIVHHQGQLLAAALDGSDAEKPRVLLDQVPEPFYSLCCVLGDSVHFFVANELAGAVYPGAPYQAALDGSDRYEARPVPWRGVALPPESGGTLLRTDAPFVSSDGEWLLAHHDSGYQLVPLRSTDKAPIVLGGPQVGSTYLSRVPEGDLLAVFSEQQLWRIPLSPSAGSEALPISTPFTGGTSSVLWQDDTRVIFTARWEDRPQSIVRASAAIDSDQELEVLVEGLPSSYPKLDALTNDRRSFVFTLPSGGGALMVAAPGQEPYPLTAETDTVETFAGWIPDGRE